jgi:hypothetical protein
MGHGAQSVKDWSQETGAESVKSLHQSTMDGGS